MVRVAVRETRSQRIAAAQALALIWAPVGLVRCCRRRKEAGRRARRWAGRGGASGAGGGLGQAIVARLLTDPSIDKVIAVSRNGRTEDLSRHLISSSRLVWIQSDYTEQAMADVVTQLAPYAPPPTHSKSAARSRSCPTAPMPCSQAKHWRTSSTLNWMNWSSPTRYRCQPRPCLSVKSAS